jgi:hypothetical protein
MGFLKEVFYSDKMPVMRPKCGGGFSKACNIKGATTIHPSFFSATFNPRVTITHKSITFNPSCINFFPNCQYFFVCIDEASLRLVVAPTTENDENGLKVAYFRNGKYFPRPCTAKHLCSALFELMKWNSEAKYLIEPDIRGFSDTEFLVFNLDECQEVCS